MHELSFGNAKRRLGAGLGVVAAHAALFYAAVNWAPHVAHALANTPVLVDFIAEPAPETPEWQPPRPQVHLQLTLTPNVPTMEIAELLPPAESKAITVAVQPPQPASTPSEAVRPRLISAVEYIKEPIPRYPVVSRRAKEEGLVILQVLIDESGRARQVVVHQSSGHVRLDEAATEAVSRALFKPYIENGEARPALVMVPIEFSVRVSSARRNHNSGDDVGLSASR